MRCQASSLVPFLLRTVTGQVLTQPSVSSHVAQQQRHYVPMVIEQTRGGGERAYDIFSRLLKERIVIVNGAIDDHTSNVIVSQLLFLESQHPEKPVRSIACMVTPARLSLLGQKARGDSDHAPKLISLFVLLGRSRCT